MSRKAFTGYTHIGADNGKDYVVHAQHCFDNRKAVKHHLGWLEDLHMEEHGYDACRVMQVVVPINTNVYEDDEFLPESSDEDFHSRKLTIK